MQCYWKEKCREKTIDSSVTRNLFFISSLRDTTHPLTTVFISYFFISLSSRFLSLGNLDNKLYDVDITNEHMSTPVTGSYSGRCGEKWSGHAVENFFPQSVKGFKKKRNPKSFLHLQ